MDYVLLAPEEVGALLNLPSDEVVCLWKPASWGLKEQNIRALERVFNDHETWSRVFGSHPEVTQSIGAGDFPVGSVGTYLKHPRPALRPGGSGRAE